MFSVAGGAWLEKNNAGTEWIQRGEGNACWVNSTKLKVTFISIDLYWIIFLIGQGPVCLSFLMQMEIAWCRSTLDGNRNNPTFLVPRSMVSWKFKRLFWVFMLLQSITSKPFNICMPAMSGWPILCAAHGMETTDESLPTGAYSVGRRHRVIKSDGVLTEKEGVHVNGAFKLIPQNLFPGSHIGGKIGKAHGNKVEN